MHHHGMHVLDRGGPMIWQYCCLVMIQDGACSGLDEKQAAASTTKPGMKTTKLL